MGHRRGFTLVEMLMVLIVLGLLATIALLKYIDLRNTARTAALTGDFRAITVAVVNYYAEYENWPPESGAGQIPNGLTPFLSGDLANSFDRPEYTLDYDNLTAGGTPLIGVSVTTPDSRLMAKFIQTFGNRAPFFQSGGSRLTYLIHGPGGFF
ncbi:MAG: type II secretion system protein [Gemmatimonadetes bacterium]|nr:type II secretion system protein [Gemmatimonadota bacterium]